MDSDAISIITDSGIDSDSNSEDSDLEGRLSVSSSTSSLGLFGKLNEKSQEQKEVGHDNGVIEKENEEEEEENIAKSHSASSSSSSYSCGSFVWQKKIVVFSGKMKDLTRSQATQFVASQGAIVRSMLF